MTYSIVARDRETGELGVAVQSRAFNTGAIVPWAAPGVGVVATQSYTEPSYGPLGLDLLRAGKTPEDALAALVAADDEPEYRQVAILDGKGRVAVHVGEACIPAAGFAAGEGFSAQANMVDSERVWESMAESFERSEGPLANRLIDALDAAEAAGATGAAARPAGSSSSRPKASRGRASSMCASTTTTIRSASCAGWFDCAGPTAPCEGRPGPMRKISQYCTSSTEPWRGSSA